MEFWGGVGGGAGNAYSWTLPTVVASVWIPPLRGCSCLQKFQVLPRTPYGNILISKKKTQRSQTGGSGSTVAGIKAGTWREPFGSQRRTFAVSGRSGSGLRAVVLHPSGFAAGLCLPLCIHTHPASRTRTRRPRSHRQASKSAALSKQGPRLTPHLVLNSVPRDAEGWMVENGCSLEDQEKWAELSSSGTEACPAAGRVTSIPSLGLVASTG